MRFHRFLALALIWMAALGVRAQGFDPERDITVRIAKGKVEVTVPEGAHLKKSFMEVRLAQGQPGTLKVGPLPPTQDVDELGDGIWRGTVRIPVTGEGLGESPKLVVTYQPCTEGVGGSCFPPTDRTLTARRLDLEASQSQPIGTVSSDGAPTAAPASAGVQPGVPLKEAAKPVERKEKGRLFLLLVAFGWGLAASLTPCVYPMIPITMAIVGAKGSGKARGFLLSLALVLGMAVTYTVLGVVVAKVGGVFGAFAQKPAFLIPVSVLFAVFSLSLFGLFEIKLPDALTAKLQGSGDRKGLGGAFIMGVVLGPLAAPCVGPFVGTVLLDIAQKGSLFLGALNLFAFALGMGVLFMAVGTFSAGLPKSGAWMIRFKQLMGVLVLGFATWNVRLILPEWTSLLLWSVTALVAAAALDAFQPAAGLGAQVRRALGMVALVLGVLLGVRCAELVSGVTLVPRGGASGPTEKAHVAWMEQDLEAALLQAKAGNKLVLVDTYAVWCAQCKELDEKTWPDPAIQAWIKEHAIAVRIDTDKVRPDLAKKERLNISSYPTILLLDAQGREVRRAFGFMEPKAMLEFLKGKS